MNLRTCFLRGLIGSVIGTCLGPIIFAAAWLAVFSAGLIGFCIGFFWTDTKEFVLLIPSAVKQVREETLHGGGEFISKIGKWFYKVFTKIFNRRQLCLERGATVRIVFFALVAITLIFIARLLITTFDWSLIQAQHHTNLYLILSASVLVLFSLNVPSIFIFLIIWKRGHGTLLLLSNWFDVVFSFVLASALSVGLINAVLRALGPHGEHWLLSCWGLFNAMFFYMEMAVGNYKLSPLEAGNLFYQRGKKVLVLFWKIIAVFISLIAFLVLTVIFAMKLFANSGRWLAGTGAALGSVCGCLDRVVYGHDPWHAIVVCSLSFATIFFVAIFCGKIMKQVNDFDRLKELARL